MKQTVLNYWGGLNKIQVPLPLWFHLLTCHLIQSPTSYFDLSSKLLQIYSSEMFSYNLGNVVLQIILAFALDDSQVLLPSVRTDLNPVQSFQV